MIHDQEVIPRPAAAPDPAFAAWLAELRNEAVAKGISPAAVEQALTSIERLPVVIERDRTQAELVLRLDQYLARRVSRKTIKSAREMAARHRTLLARVGAKYGVPPRIIVAVWGLESNFGQFTGVRPTIAALATLAYDTRRPAFFRGELFDALRILDRQDIDIASMKGSWAGAMGQPQFMPSSYLKYAEDFDGDGRRDIWASLADVFASVANYLKAHGWTSSRTWGREVRVSAAAAKRIATAVGPRTAGCDASGRATELLPLARWQELGVRLPGNKPLPRADLNASLVKAGSRSFLVYENYEVVLAYNCAHAYALSVGLLADRIGS
ncbi:MAG: lytic murein transglycosylase [Acidobacteria bacterium]|nr:lytic murein transglycosylase [Acidobacteriota bacterium]